MPGRSKRFLGVETSIYSKYSKNSVTYRGYSIRINKFLEWLLLGKETQ